MASHTDSGILPHRFLAARNPMRIVTSGAFHFSAALEETARLPQPVNRAYRLEFAFVPGARRVVERDREIYRGLSRHIRERAPVESLERRRDAPAGGFEVALHTHLHPPLGTQLRRIHHADPAGGSNMLASGTVASLAIDPLRKFPKEHRLTTGRLVGSWYVRIAVMAEHALIRDEPEGLRMLRVGPGHHAPSPAFVRVPAQRQFDQHATLGAVQIRAGMVSRPHYIIDFHFFGVDLVAAGVQLPAALEVLAVPDRHRVMAVGKGMVVFGGLRIILNRVAGSRCKERPAHSGARVVRRDFPVACGAELRVYVSISWTSSRTDLGRQRGQAQEKQYRERRKIHH